MVYPIFIDLVLILCELNAKNFLFNYGIHHLKGCSPAPSQPLIPVGYSVGFWIEMLSTARRLETLQESKKGDRNYIHFAQFWWNFFVEIRRPPPPPPPPKPSKKIWYHHLQIKTLWKWFEMTWHSCEATLMDIFIFEKLSWNNSTMIWYIVIQLKLSIFVPWYCHQCRLLM